MGYIISGEHNYGNHGPWRDDFSMATLNNQRVG